MGAMRRPVRSCLLLVTLALVAPALAREPRTVTLRFPRFTLPPRANSERCLLFRLPLRTAFDLGWWEIRHRERGLAVQHFLVYLYTGERLAEFAADAGRIVDSRACLDLGPADRDRRQLIFSGAGQRSRGALPAGVALPLAPVPDTPGGAPAGIGILLDANWVNPTTRTGAGATRVVLHRARRGRVTRLAQPLFDRTAEGGLSVPPGAVRSTEDSTEALGAPRLRDAWTAPADACVVFATGHQHERGRLFAIDRLGADHSIANPPGGPENPFEPGRRHLFATTDYTDPGTSNPLVLAAGEALHYACWPDNGFGRARRLGCEEMAGQVPGIAAGLPSGGAAKPCTAAVANSPECPPSDPAYLGRSFTGACVTANLVAGNTPDDEVCALAGLYYDAAPGGSCDVGGLPPLP